MGTIKLFILSLFWFGISFACPKAYDYPVNDTTTIEVHQCDQEISIPENTPVIFMGETLEIPEQLKNIDPELLLQIQLVDEDKSGRDPQSAVLKIKKWFKEKSTTKKAQLVFSYLRIATSLGAGFSIYVAHTLPKDVFVSTAALTLSTAISFLTIRYSAKWVNFMNKPKTFLRRLALQIGVNSVLMSIDRAEFGKYFFQPEVAREIPKTLAMGVISSLGLNNLLKELKRQKKITDANIPGITFFTGLLGSTIYGVSLLPIDQAATYAQIGYLALGTIYWGAFGAVKMSENPKYVLMAKKLIPFGKTKEAFEIPSCAALFN